MKHNLLLLVFFILFVLILTSCAMPKHKECAKDSNGELSCTLYDRLMPTPFSIARSIVTQGLAR